MQKVSHLFLSFIFILLASCTSDDRPKETDSVPSKATNITVVPTPLTATVTITWNAATDADGDAIRYDVSINKEPVKTNLSNTSVEVDITQFLPMSGKRTGMNGSKNFLENKGGLEVVLEIEVKSYDPNGNFSTNSITETVPINRSPSAFTFENIYFDTDAYNLLQISWSPSTDADNDPLFYTIYLNDIVIAEEYQISSGEALGTIEYNEDFLALSEEEMTVRIVVTDKSEETKEISESFDFKETDIELGMLEAAYNEEVQFNIEESEPDYKVGYRFSVAEQTNFSIGNSENATMQIKDAQNNTLFSDASFVGVLEAGDYTLIIIGDEDSSVSGLITFDLTSSAATDVDLGVLNVPSINDVNFAFENEEDNIINYYFEITEPTGYIITSRLLPESSLYNENGELIGDNSGPNGRADMFMDEIPAGKYRFAINSSFNTSGTFKIYLKNSTETDKNLGVLANNATHELSFTPDAEFNFEPDRSVRIYFEIEETTGLMVPLTFQVTLDAAIRDMAGNLVARVPSSGYEKIVDFEPGAYFLEINFNRYFGMNMFDQTMILQDPTLTDADWGIISTPTSINGSVNAEPDDKVVYTFETLEMSPRWYYGISDNSGDMISFTDEAGNEVPRNATGPAGGSTPAGIDLPAGKYRIEITDGQGVGQPGYGITFSFHLY